MNAALPLDERIADAFAPGQTLGSKEIARLLSEVAAARVVAGADDDRASEIALDPATRPAAVDEARKTMLEAKFRVERLDIVSDRLRGMLEAAQRDEAAEVRRQQVEELTTKRDALVEDLRATYPGLVDQLGKLLERTFDIDGECRRYGIATAETLARPGVMGNSVHPLTACRLVDFQCRHDSWVWVDGRRGANFATQKPLQQIETTRVIVTNARGGGPRGFHDAHNKLVMLEPGASSHEIDVLESDVARFNRNSELDVETIGTGELVWR